MKVEKINLEADERIIIEVRKHWFVLATQLIGILMGALLPPALYFGLSNNTTLPIASFTLHTGIIVALYSAWLLIAWMALFNIWTNYYLDVWTVTNRRLIAVDQRGFFFRNTASFRLERLQDISVSINGLLATLLDFGSLEIQTAGEEGNFKIQGLPKPGELKALILSAADPLSAQESKSVTLGV